MKQKFSVGKALGILLLGAIIGGIIGELFGMILPESVVKEFLLTKYTFGFTNPLMIDLNIIAFSFSLMFRMNVVSFLGIVFGYYILKYTR
ncbi:MAG: DUF4321 domain-containing protein [Candidatus Marinimicrobia bacterium]|jgi:hypothetical protein|nr:DUF4321 domain-containing protein [Candidatus Neomarinimicrobiota bacterium]MDD5581785.1 DUF4321 domain-containing protein [Candidatus Neomarinimicrobiota bacterium]